MGGLGWVGSRPHPDLRDHGRRPSLRVTAGPAGARLSGRKACRTDDRPLTPRWHTREGDAAVPVCMGRARGSVVKLIKKFFFYKKFFLLSFQLSKIFFFIL